MNKRKPLIENKNNKNKLLSIDLLLIYNAPGVQLHIYNTIHTYIQNVTNSF